jgi:heme A synthase
MLTGLEHTHRLLRYIILIFLVWTVINAFLKKRGNKPFLVLDNKLSLYTFILAHTQLLIGLALYFLGANGINLFDKGMSKVMSVSLFRFYAIEHLVGMLIAIALITVGRIRMKKAQDDTAKHQTIFLYYLIALIIIFVSIPWPFRNLGTSWL